MPLNRSDMHFLRMAQIQGEKSQFSRKKRGAVIVKDNKVIAAGISSHLDDKVAGQALAKLNDNERYVATVNAEIMAIGVAVKAGINLNNVTIYTSDCPNWQVFKTLVVMGIKRIVHYGPTTSDRIGHYSQQLGIELLSVAI